MRKDQPSGAWMPSPKRPMTQVWRLERSQIRRIYLREGKRWRRTHSWGSSDDKDFVPKGQ